jgi:hypothetical protein
VFLMVVNFILENWEPMHVTIGLFETSNTIDAIMVVPWQVYLCLKGFGVCKGWRG